MDGRRRFDGGRLRNYYSRTPPVPMAGIPNLAVTGPSPPEAVIVGKAVDFTVIRIVVVLGNIRIRNCGCH